MKGWTTENDMVQMDGKVVIVTGSNSGIGFEAAKAFANAGAHVVFACRTESKANAAIDRVTKDNPDVSVEFIALDLSNLQSVRTFTEAFKEKFDRLDVLANNAGLMVPPYTKTTDGFEIQMGTNHFGHFALTGQLIDVLTKTPGARVVTVSSSAHQFGSMNFEDLHWETRSYKPWPAYGQSKLANLLFTYELQRRFDEAGLDIKATAAHPGWTATELQKNSGFKLGNRYFAQRPHQGAWPTLAAAVADAKGGEYFGPSGFMEVAGPAKVVKSNKKSHDKDAQKKLWDISEQLTGVTFDFAKKTNVSAAAE